MNIFAILGSLLLLLVAFCAYLVVKLPKRYFIKYLLIPVILAYGLLIATNYTEVQGHPYATFPHGKFLLVAFRTIGVDEKRVIEIWITQHGISRLYVIPYDADVETKLKMAKIGEEEGELFELQFDGDPTTKGKTGADGHSLGEKLTAQPIDVKSSLPPKKE